MNTLVLQALGWALVHLLWQGTLVALALAVALKVVERRAASLRYLLSCGALALLLVLPVLTAWRHVTVSRSRQAEDRPLLWASPALPPYAGSSPASPGAPKEPGALALASEARVTRLLGMMSVHMPWLVLCWGLGVLGSSLRLLSGWVRLRRLVREAEPAPAEWQTSLERLAGRLDLSRPVRLLRSGALDVPAAVGWLRPVVLLPMATLTGLSARQLEMVLAHELAHLRRHDFVVNLVQTLVETLLFYHPAVWWMSHVIRVEREHCCDDIAVRTSGSAVSYARALTALEALRVPALQVAHPGLSALGGSLTVRVRRLVGAPATRCSSRAGAPLLALLGGLAVVTPLAVLALPAQAVPPPVAAPLPATPSIIVPLIPLTVPVPAPSPVLPTAPVTPLAPLAVPVPVPAPHLSRAAQQDLEEADEEEQVEDADSDSDAEEDEEREEAEDPVHVEDSRGSVGPLARLGTAGVTPERVKEVEALGYEPTVSTLVQFSHAHITPEYVKEMTSVLGRRPTVSELVQMKHVGVTPERARALAAWIGQDTLFVERLTQAAALNVSESFLRGLREAGYGELPFEKLLQLRALGVTPQYIQGLRDAGFASLSAEQLSEFKALGVSAEYLRSLRDAGLDRLPAEQVVQLRALGVTPGFIHELRDEGLDKLTAEELIRLRASGVDADVLHELREKK